LSAGDHLIIFHDTYGANYKVSLILERLGVDITWIDAENADKVEKYVRPETKMIFLETPSNPLCKIIDIQSIRKAADTADAMVVVDNTFATPFHQNPLERGADLVVHSATKALGGHNDLMAGAVAGSKEHYNRLWFTRQAIGTTLDPYSAFLLDRGLKTFELRMETMSRNARQVAELLQSQTAVSRLMYPGFNSHPAYKTAARQMKNGFGNMMAFDVGTGEEDAKRFIAALKTVRHAVSLGSTESLICIPYLTTMLYLPPERRTIFGVRKNTVRLSVGIEPFDKIAADITQALTSL
jgi:cystathionine gamma-lyase/homocysteine desulfhydrase